MKLFRKCPDIQKCSKFSLDGVDWGMLGHIQKENLIN